MTAHTVRRRLVGFAVAVGLVAGGAPWGGARAAAAQEQSLYIAFTDFNGAPVTDMTLDDVVIQWDGVPCEIVELEPIQWPVRVTVYVDNATESQAALPDMREGLRLFLEALPPDIEVAIATTAGRPQFRVRHTRDRGDLLDAVGVLASEGSAATFFDALYEEAERLEDDREREYLSAIVMVAVAGSEGSRRARGDAIQRTMDRLYDNAAVVHTLLFTAPYGVGRTLGRAQATWGSDFAASTRGRYEEMVVSTRYRTLLPEIAADLARRHRMTRSQYRVTFRPPEDASDQPRLQVGSARVGVVAIPTDNGNVP